MQAMSRFLGILASAGIALVIFSFHAVATPSAAGACAQVELHHASQVDSVDEERWQAGNENVDANAAYLNRDGIPQRPGGVVHVAPTNKATCEVLVITGSDPPPPDLSELSQWRV